MEQNYISDDVFEQIKDFKLYDISEEQNLLIDKLIPNKELQKRFKVYGLCKGCNQPKSSGNWCQSCNSKKLQQNFKNWTSGNSDVDKLIQESQLNGISRVFEWVEYDRFKNIEYITKGGFGKVYKAIWKDGFMDHWDYRTNEWIRNDNISVALKCLNNSKDITLEFLNEINSHLKMDLSSSVMRLYGITKDPKSNNFMMVMRYAEDGSLRQILNKNFNSMDWLKKFNILRYTARGLSDIHREGLIHQDFHCGNILYNNAFSYVTDLGLCKPADEKSEKCNKNIYGVLPYVAPEVLRGKEYMQASDNYALGIIIYEVCNGSPPYHDMAHDEFLAVKVCQGLRPKFIIKVPKLVEDIFKQCVDADPLKRPTADYLHKKFDQWYWDIYNSKYNSKYDSDVYKQTKEADEFNKNRPTFTNSSSDTGLTYTTHTQAIYTSRLLNFKNLPEPKNADDGEFLEDYSESIKIDLANLNINS